MQPVPSHFASSSYLAIPNQDRDLLPKKRKNSLPSSIEVKALTPSFDMSIKKRKYNASHRPKLSSDELLTIDGIIGLADVCKRSKIFHSDGTRYEGEMRGNKKHGTGILFYPDQTTFEGQFEDDSPASNGRLTFPSGFVYEGICLNGKPHGYGTLIYPNGDTYRGSFVQGKRHGRGVVKGKEPPFIFMGMFEDDKIKGEGFLRHLNQDWCQGVFDGAGLQGMGTSCINKSSYTGEFENSLPHGLGKEILPNGIICEGTFEHGYMVQGMVTFPEGTIYEGTLQKRLFHGRGVLRFADYLYDGEFVEGVKHGKGSLQFTNGDVFTGEFKADQPYGMGIYKTIHGFSLEGHICSTQ